MKLVMTLLVRDEADIIASNIEFHLNQGVDFIIAMDNLSTDTTPQILRAYERRGLLCYLHQPEDNYAQNRWVTDMARMACTEFAADWVINNDADEFWWPEQGDLKQILGAMPPSCAAVAVERTNFMPRPLSPGEFFADMMTVRERRSVNALGAPLPGKVCHRAYPDIVVTQGNHGVHRRGHAIATLPAAITILHFPVRSYRQFANKIAKGGAAYTRNTELPIGTGSTWRHLYKIWQKGKFEAYYQRLIADADQKIAKKHGIFDDRLKRFFARMHSGDK